MLAQQIVRKLLLIVRCKITLSLRTQLCKSVHIEIIQCDIEVEVIQCDIEVHQIANKI
jgi:hypothetical protein